MTDDKEIWDTYKRAVKPAPRRRDAAIAAKPTADKKARRKAAESAPPQMPKLAAGRKLRADALRALERKRERALRQGDVEIEARLDLHGMTQAQAFERLAAFMHKQAKAGKRCLLIITGKGSAGTGVLRGNLHNWLGQLPEADAILALRPAALKHGGSGAFYIILRKSS